MTEKLLQYIWQFQYYNSNSLITTEGDALQVINPGTINYNQGADFLNAKLRINKTIWAGSIELHIKSGEWYAHKHGSDNNYDNVILHVVWEHNQPKEFSFPTLELYHRVPQFLLTRYEQLMLNQQAIPCGTSIQDISLLTVNAWKDRLFASRLEEKQYKIREYLEQNNGDWEETFWWMLARNFGSPVNNDAFEELARSISVKVLIKNSDQHLKMEALLFGQAKLLNRNFSDAYPILLKKEYSYLKNKYSLSQIFIPVHALRMRPANFPAIRIAQLSALLTNFQQLFSKLREAERYNDLKTLLTVTANDYWHYHYQFEGMTAYKPKILGEQMIRNVIINTIIPLLFSFADQTGNEALKVKVIRWIQEMPAEKNKILKDFEALGFENNTAFDSQALLFLKKFYCLEKRCLQCAIGHKIVHP